MATSCRLLLLLLPLLPLLLLLLPGSCTACNLTQRIYASGGVLHRCVSDDGTNQWRMRAACWLAADSGGSVQELEVGESSRDSAGRPVAECRRRGSDVALVPLACDAANGSRRWPGDVWPGPDGRRLTCVAACDSDSRRYFSSGAGVVTFGCDNGTAEPNSTRRGRDGLLRLCAFSGCETRTPSYGWRQAIGCWLSHRRRLVRLGVGENFEALVDGRRLLAASCRRRRGDTALVWHLCRSNLSADGAARPPGSRWTDASGLERECLPPDSSEFGDSARTVARGCFDAGRRLLPPGAEMRVADSRVVRCSFNKYRRRYGWYDTVGCWEEGSIWRQLSNGSVQLAAGEEFCLDGNCVARCVKKRYSSKVALVRVACFDSVGDGVQFRMPNANWTDAEGVKRTCVPMANQRYSFGQGAKTVARGCGSAPPGATRLDADFLVRRCSFDERRREFNFERVVGCWLLQPNGSEARMGIRESYSLPDGRLVASCRKKSRYSDVAFTAEACFVGNSTPLAWSEATVAFPGDVATIGGRRRQCNRAAKYSSGVHARWIVFGCPGSANGSETTAPGTERLDADGVLRRCAHNGMDGGRAAYSWDSAVGCWFADHRNRTMRLEGFNEEFRHPDLRRPVAVCRRSSRYSDPELRFLVCFSSGGEVYDRGDSWTDAGTGFAKECVAASKYYDSHGVVAIDSGCRVSVAAGNGTRRQRLLANGSLAFGDENRVLRCDFNDYKRRYEWLTSVACWTLSNGTKTTLQVGQEVWQAGLLVAKCHSGSKGAVYLRHSCRHSGVWRPALGSWRDGRFRFTCRPASVSSGRHAKAEKTHCVTDGGKEIDSTETIDGVEYLCMHICGFLVFFRQPTPQQMRLVFNFINNCHSVNMAIINGIG